MKKIKVSIKQTYLKGKGLVRGLRRMNKLLPKGSTLEELIRKRLRCGEVRLLEVGCGRGNALKELAQKFKGKNVELWGSNLVLAHGPRKAKDFKIKVDDVTQSKFRSNFFDIIVSQVTFAHIIRKDKALEEIYRILKPRGVAFIEFDHKLNEKYFSYEDGKMPLLFSQLNKALSKEALSRFIIYRNRKFCSFFKIVKNLQSKGFDVKIIAKKSKEKTIDYEYLLYLRKTKSQLKLPLSYNLKKSEELARKPLGYGYIDAYDLK